MHKGAGLGADIYLIIYIGGVTSALPSAGGVAWGRKASRVVCFYIKPQRVIELAGSHDGCISSVSYIKPQPIITNKLYTNMLLIFFIIKNGRVGFVSIAKILKKLQLNRFADDFFCDFA